MQIMFAVLEKEQTAVTPKVQ